MVNHCTEYNGQIVNHCTEYNGQIVNHCTEYNGQIVLLILKLSFNNVLLEVWRSL